MGLSWLLDNLGSVSRKGQIRMKLCDFPRIRRFVGEVDRIFPRLLFSIVFGSFFCSSSHCLCFVLAGGQLACTTFTLYKTPLPRIRGEGGRLLELLCPSVRPSVRQSNRVRSVSPDPLNHF